MRKSSKSQTKLCPYCGRTVSAAAVVCVYCDHDLFDLEAPEETAEERSAASPEADASGGTLPPDTAASSATAQSLNPNSSFSETPAAAVPLLEVDSQQFAAQAGEFAAQEMARSAAKRKSVVISVVAASVVIFGSAIVVARRDTTHLRSRFLPSTVTQAAPPPRVPLASVPDLFAVQLAAALPVTDTQLPRTMANGRLRIRMENVRNTIGNAYKVGNYVLPDELRLMVGEIRNETTVPLTDFQVTAEGYDKKGKSLGKVTRTTDLVAAPGDNFSFAVPFNKVPGNLPPEAVNPLASIGPVSAGRLIQGGAPLRPIVMPPPNPFAHAASGRIIEITARPLLNASVSPGMPKMDTRKPAAVPATAVSPKPGGVR